MNQTTDLQSRYWAKCLTLLRPHESHESLARPMASARVELNPHQVDAALFALHSPLSQGVILADEVGLGKTIEAGIVLLQFWVERKRRLLLLMPAALRSQWQAELLEKFGIPAVVVEDRFWKTEQNRGQLNPLNPKNPSSAFICSYHFAARHSDELAAVNWDLVVCDEAHHLRSLHRSTGNKITKTLEKALQGKRKLLLSATPLQNDLAELWSLIYFIDPHVFGHKEAFQAQFAKLDDNDTEQLQVLRKQLATLCKRTLRREVQEYIRFTERKALLFKFNPTDAEQQLYEDVSNFLQREELVCIPTGQRKLMTLVLRKLLASSSFAITATLEKYLERLKQQQTDALSADVQTDFETFGELVEEWSDSDENTTNGLGTKPSAQKLIAEEIALLEDMLARARKIQYNSKGQRLLDALQQVFAQVEAGKAARKAVIFTESRRTQDYLFELLEANGYEGQVIRIRGQNDDDQSRRILQEWKSKHSNGQSVRGNESVNMKAALVEAFRERASILIATEAAAEGINLQFCSVVINYDLPWNPQRIEQRIGRCHRYGQQHDVVVVNFLNERNEADKRVYELLDQKFKLFEGVFGSSDQVLGAVESGIDIEKTIAEIYQTCRTSEEITRAFEALQQELSEKLEQQRQEVRQRVLDHLDEGVAERLAVHNDKIKRPLNQRQAWLFNLTRHELGNQIQLTDDGHGFTYQGTTYHLSWQKAKDQDWEHYHEQHELAQQLIERAQNRPADQVQLLTFDYAAAGRKISALEERRGQKGWLQVNLLRYPYSEPVEYLLLVCLSDTGQVWDEELAQILLELPASAQPWTGDWPQTLLEPPLLELIQQKDMEVQARNNEFLEEEIDKIEFWVESRLAGLEVEIKNIDKQIKELKRKTTSRAIDPKVKLELQKQIAQLEKERRKLRNEREREEERISEQRENMIEEAQKRLEVQHQLQTVMRLRWELV